MDSHVLVGYRLFILDDGLKRTLLDLQILGCFCLLVFYYLAFLQNSPHLCLSLANVFLGLHDVCSLIFYSCIYIDITFHTDGIILNRWLLNANWYLIVFIATRVKRTVSKNMLHFSYVCALSPVSPHLWICASWFGSTKIKSSRKTLKFVGVLWHFRKNSSCMNTFMKKK